MTESEEKLIAAGRALANSIGHKFGARCPKVSPAVPCTCGGAAQQARALQEWYTLVQKIKDS